MKTITKTLAIVTTMLFFFNASSYAKNGGRRKNNPDIRDSVMYFKGYYAGKENENAKEFKALSRATRIMPGGYGSVGLVVWAAATFIPPNPLNNPSVDRELVRNPEFVKGYRKGGLEAQRYYFNGSKRDQIKAVAITGAVIGGVFLIVKSNGGGH